MHEKRSRSSDFSKCVSVFIFYTSKRIFRGISALSSHATATSDRRRRRRRRNNKVIKIIIRRRRLSSPPCVHNICLPRVIVIRGQ